LIIILLFLWTPTIFAKPHNAFPSVENLGDDTIMVVFRSGTTHFSDDGDIKTFRGYYDQFDDTLNTYTLFRSPAGIDFRDPSIRMLDGVLILTFDYVNYNIGRDDIVISRSYDKGITWTMLENVTQGMNDSYRWWTSTEMAETKNKVWILPLYRWESKLAVWSAGTIRSTDFGRSWEDYVPVVYGSGDSLSPSEPSVVQLNDGSLFFLAREDNLNNCMYYSYSFDEGKTWQPAQLWFEPGMAPWVYKDTDGHILVSYGAKDPWGVALTKSLNSFYPLKWGDVPRVVPYTDPATYTYPSLCRIKFLSNSRTNCYFLVNNIEWDHYAGDIGDTLIFLPKYSVTDVESPSSSLPNKFTVSAYPNPFNPINTLSIDALEKSDMKIEVVNILGERVARIFDGIINRGLNSYTWDASNYPSGIYFYRVKSGGNIETKRITLLK